MKRFVPAAAVLLALLLPLGAGWIAAQRIYRSWHPCDWLLQDAVGRTLERYGIEPDSVSVVVKARAVESAEVRLRMRGQHTAPRCLATWMLRRVAPAFAKPIKPARNLHGRTE